MLGSATNSAERVIIIVPGLDQIVETAADTTTNFLKYNPLKEIIEQAIPESKVVIADYLGPNNFPDDKAALGVGRSLSRNISNAIGCNTKRVDFVAHSFGVIPLYSMLYQEQGYYKEQFNGGDTSCNVVLIEPMIGREMTREYAVGKEDTAEGRAFGFKPSVADYDRDEVDVTDNCNHVFNFVRFELSCMTPSNLRILLAESGEYVLKSAFPHADIMSGVNHGMGLKQISNGDITEEENRWALDSFATAVRAILDSLDCGLCERDASALDDIIQKERDKLLAEQIAKKNTNVEVTSAPVAENFKAYVPSFNKRTAATLVVSAAVIVAGYAINKLRNDF